MPKIALIDGIFMSIFKFYHFDLFWTLFEPFLAFGYIWGQINIDFLMRLYKLCKHAKSCIHKWYFYGHF